MGQLQAIHPKSGIISRDVYIMVMLQLVNPQFMRFHGLQ